MGPRAPGPGIVAGDRPAGYPGCGSPGGAPGVVVHQPGIQSGLQLVHTLVERLAKLDHEELVEHGLMEALHKAVRVISRRRHASLTFPSRSASSNTLKRCRATLISALMRAASVFSKYMSSEELETTGYSIYPKSRNRRLTSSSNSSSGAVVTGSVSATRRRCASTLAWNRLTSWG